MLKRLGFVLLAVFVIFIGGSSYYNAFLPVRIVTHVALTALVTGWLIVRIRRGAFLPVTPLNGPLFAAAGVLALAAVFSLDPRMAVESLWWPLVHGLIFFFLAAEIASGRQRRLFETQFLLAALAVVFAGMQLLSWWFGWSITPETVAGVANAVDLGAWLRGAAEFPPIAPMIYLPLHISTALAGFAAPQIIQILSWARTASRRDGRLALVGLAGALVVVLLATGSRGGILSLALGIIAFLLLHFIPSVTRQIRAKQGGWIRTAIVIASVLLIAASALAAVLYIGRSSARASGDDIRLSLWSSAMDTVQEYPIFGVGPSEFGRAHRVFRESDSPADFKHRQAHNIVLNTAAEEGIAGVLVLGWLAAALVWGWWRQRRVASPGRALRLDAVLAALVAVAVQAQFDVFFTTPFVVLVALLVAYAVTEPTILVPRRAEKVAACVALVAVVAFALFWIPVDAAHSQFQSSLREQSLEPAEAAAALDPALRLYDLQIAYGQAMDAFTDPAALPDATAAMEAALAAEPTWDTGWIVLAGLYEQAGRIPDALAALETAAALNRESPARWNWARIADAHDAAPDEAIASAYTDVLARSLAPFSAAWTATPRRQQALESFFASSGPRMQYLLAEAFFPERVDGLVPADPQTADEWWVVGQHALHAEGDAQAAFEAFSEAVRVNPNREVGDYYAARARAGTALGGDALDLARRDAAMASVLATLYERPAIARAAIAEASGATGDTLRAAWASAAPSLIVEQNFEGVLFGGRTADFQLPPALRPPGPGPAAFAPLYALAADYEASDEPDRAERVYRYILDIAPEESRAADGLAGLAQGDGA